MLVLLVAGIGVCCGTNIASAQTRVYSNESPRQPTNQNRRTLDQESRRSIQKPVQPSQAQRIPATSGRGRVTQATARMPNGYLPQHLRVSQAVSQEPIEDQGAPVMSGNRINNQVPSEVVYDGDFYGDATIGESYIDDCGNCGSCDSCLSGCGHDNCGTSCRSGGCPPELLANCWIGGIGKFLRRAEYFSGATAFQSTAFPVAQLQNEFSDCSFGFYTGANVGVPLCRLTCGLVSGQVGVRSVQSDYSGALFTSDNRDQMFVTTGLYRRVDYGLQVGVVLDYLREDWITQVDLMQIRGDISWVYPSGSAFGFRFSENIQDTQSSGIINGQRFTNLVSSTYDTYRFYYRNGCFGGGYSDFFLGWSDEQHFVGGMEYDIPISECWAAQSGFTYMFPQDNPQRAPFAGNDEDAWNISVGLVWRPQGRSWYRNYDQPILPVADNGSMIIRRRF